MNTPAVSVVMAAYNRSNVLKYAIASVLQSTHQDWELLVVDDVSTDDTAQVVAGFTDPRIRYIRLEKNIGEQSGPNNVGISLARGRYVAFLSQDDLWFPDHLQRMVAAIADGEADGVFSLAFTSVSNDRMVLSGSMPDGIYDPRYGQHVVASLWLMKRELLQDLGGWRFFRDIRITPSQDLLLRAWKAGRKLRMVPAATVIVIQSGSRTGSYSRRDEEPNKKLALQMRNNPKLREDLLLGVLQSQVNRDLIASLSLRSALICLVKTAAKRLGLMMGMTPMQLLFLMRHYRKGSYVHALRQRRGLGRLETDARGASKAPGLGE